MTELSQPDYDKICDASTVITQLQQGCVWAGIERGRATQYSKLISEFFAGKGSSPEHVLACYEAIEITNVYELWSQKVEEYPGLKARIAETFKSGPIIRENENLATSSNRPRNDAFSFLIAGRLLAAGCDVLAVDGIRRVTESTQWVGDATVRQDGIVLDVQCKRPQTSGTIQSNIDKATDQILGATFPGAGIIVIDLSVIIRPGGMFLPADSVAIASAKLSNLIQPHAEAAFASMGCPQISGIVWFATLPCRISGVSRILNPAGGRDEVDRPYHAAEIAIALNPNSPHADALRHIGERFQQWMKSR